MPMICLIQSGGQFDYPFAVFKKDFYKQGFSELLMQLGLLHSLALAVKFQDTAEMRSMPGFTHIAEVLGDRTRALITLKQMEVSHLNAVMAKWSTLALAQSRHSKSDCCRIECSK